VKRRRERPILVGGVVLALVVLLATGGLVAYALAGVAASDAERHRLVAERLFDEIEGELSAIVAREEGRSFLEYTYFYVPNDNAYGNPGLVQSELSKEPAEPWIVGWFQVDPGNVVSTPLVPRANEMPLAVRNGTWSTGASVEPLDRLRDILGQAGWSARPEPPPFKVARAKPKPAPQPEPSTGTDADLLLNRNVQKRAARVAQVVSTKELNLSSFVPNSLEVDQLVRQEEAAQQQAQQEMLQQVQQKQVQQVQWQEDQNQEVRPPTPLQDTRAVDPRVQVEAQAKLDPEVKVVVTPLVGTRAGEHLVLYRTVRIGEDEHRQGLVLRRDELARHLEEVVLGSSELRRYVSLAWDGAEPAPAVYRFDHRFADPFGSMAVSASLSRVPALLGRDALTVPALAGAVLLAVFGGGVALYRAVRSELEYARRRNDFVAAVSHELKTPLTTIRMYAEMLRDGMVPGADRQRTYHHTITMESDRLGRLIANVLELARLERGGPTPEVIAGSIEPVLREAVEIVRPHAAAAGFTIAVHAQPGLPPVRIDPDALTQIVVNLVDNAVKFAQAGERRIELTLREEDGGVVVSVRDHGPGVPRAQLRRVFEPFWRGERELTRKTRGTGIGLALVRGLAQRMGASVAARNHPEGGFEVVLTLGA
jgi:signal transduction histidine kinase